MSAAPPAHSVFATDGEMAALCRDFDWSRTSLGPVEEWPAALRTTVRMALESPFPINLWCGQDKLLIYNDAYRIVLGAKHPRALGMAGREVWHEIWRDVEPMFARVDTGIPVFAEDARFVMERTDGPPAEAWFTFSLSPVRDESGSVVAYLNIASESTDRILLQRELVEARSVAERAENQLRAVFAQAPAFMAVVRGPKHVFEFTNDAYQKVIGGRPTIGKTVAEALPEVVEQGFIALLDKVYATGEPFIGREIEVQLAIVPGAPHETRYVDFVYQPLVDENGQPTGIVVHGSDVTDAVRARRRVEESESRYRFLANSIPVQVWTATPDGALNYVSDRTAAYFGMTPEQVIGDQWVSVLHSDDVDATLKRWRHSLETGEPYEVEFRLWSSSANAFRWHLGRAVAQRDENGAVAGWFGTNTDIEDAKRAEAELKRLTVEATEANQAKSNFLAAMSHELRTPLNAIGGYAQLIEMGVRGPVTEDQRLDLLKIQRSKNHLDALVSDVLNFAKLGAGKIEYRFQNLDVAENVQAVIEMIAPQAQERQLTVEVAPIPSGLTVWADSDKLRQILVNILTNAVKFTRAGGRISVVTTHDAAMVSLAVSDNGIGIGADQIERIFEPFVQAKRQPNLHDHGVGLGLAISRQLARAMRGEVTVTSKVDVGSTFTVQLPIRS